MSNEEAGSRVWVPDELFSWRTAEVVSVEEGGKQVRVRLSRSLLNCGVGGGDGGVSLDFGHDTTPKSVEQDGEGDDGSGGASDPYLATINLSSPSAV